MNDSLLDAGALVLASLAYVPLLVLPGVALAGASGVFGFRLTGRGAQAAVGLVVGLALLPFLDSMATRFFGLGSALAVNLVLAMAALIHLGWAGARFSLDRGAVAAVLMWLLLVILESIDFDWRGALYQPLSVIDMVKHAATIQAIHDSGAPPWDPFFARPTRSSYYYFFYTLGALAERAGGGFIDARAAMGGLVFWTGLGVYATARLMLRQAALGPVAGRRAGLLVAMLMLASGLDIVPVVKKILVEGLWLSSPGEWTEQVTPWPSSILWVPHHVTALIAGLVGFAALVEGVEAVEGRSLRAAMPKVLVAALCFADSLGLSIWVTLPAVMTAGLWSAWLLIERRFKALLTLAAAGALSLLAASPQLADLSAGRSGAALPIRLTVRDFPMVDQTTHDPVARTLARLLCLPLNYLAEFGVFFSGAILFWSMFRWRAVHRNEMARVLTLGALSGLLLGSFLRSTLYNDDLGWRVTLYPQFTTLLWTVVALDRSLRKTGAEGAPSPPAKRLPTLIVVFAATGYLTTAYALVMMRAYRAVPLVAERRFINAHPMTDRALRTAYVWAARHLPRRMVLQHNPTTARAFDFGLYGANRVAVADSFAGLYGAPQAAVLQRFNEVFPIFAVSSPPSAVRARAAANGIDALIVTADDPVWANRTSWVWRARPVYASPSVRIVPVGALGGER